MTTSPRQMRLTPELVARVTPHVGTPNPLASGFLASSDADYDAATEEILAGLVRRRGTITQVSC